MARQLTAFLRARVNHNLGAPQVNNSHQDGMHFELLRLASFKTWPRWAPLAPNRLARAGFFYTGRDDKTKCFSCHCILDQWRDGDDVRTRHCQNSLDCAFVRGTDRRNVPLPRPAESLTLGQASGTIQIRENGENTNNDCLPRSSTTPRSLLEPEYIDEAASGATERIEHASLASSSTGNATFAHSFPPPRSLLEPEYEDQEVRRQTFRSSPSNASIPAQKLAKAGFIYVGTSDRVQCVFCKGILQKWKPGDEPLLKHQHYLLRCPFINHQTQQGILGAPTPSSHLDRECFCLGSDQPKHPALATENMRLATFISMPPARYEANRSHSSEDNPRNIPTATAEELAKAGFFNIPGERILKCYSCDGNLDCRSLQGDIWEEHAGWAPQCQHVKSCKGNGYMDVIQISKHQQFIESLNS